MPKLIEKPIGLSREDVEKAPPLVSRKFFLCATGLDKDTFHGLVSTGGIKRLSLGRYGKYYKADIMRICGYIRIEVKNGNH